MPPSPSQLQYGSRPAPVIGIDVGGTKVAGAFLGRGGVGKTVLWSTSRANTQALLDQFVDLIEEVSAGRSYAAVGIGVPSTVRSATGEVVSSVNVPLAGVPLRKLLSERIGKPVFVDNDANVAAFAEAHDEAFRLVARHLVMLTVGTGIGGGIIIDGQIFRGSSGGAGEFGHTLIAVETDPDLPPAGHQFPQPGALERLASGQALDWLARSVAASHPQSLLAAAEHTHARPVSGADAIRAAQSGDLFAAVVVKRWARRLGIGIANAINTFDPDEIVIGGGGTAAGDLLLQPAADVAHGYVHPGIRGRARIRLARWGPAAGVVGAALLATNQLERTNT